ALCLGAHLPRAVGAADRGGQVAAAVRGDDLQSRMPVEHTGEDEVRQRDGVLRRLADRVRQVEAVEPFVEGASERMQEDGGADARTTRPPYGVRIRRNGTRRRSTKPSFSYAETAAVFVPDACRKASSPRARIAWAMSSV